MIVSTYTRLLTLLAVVAMSIITALLVINVVLRQIASPILGVVEIVAYAMLALIVTSLAYVQSSDSHISVDIVTSHFSARWQYVFEVVAHMLTIVTAMLLGIVFWNLALSDDVSLESSGLITISSTPLKYLVSLGCAAWALEATRSAVRASVHLMALSGSGAEEHDLLS